MNGYQPDPTLSGGQLLHAAVTCLMNALDAEAVRDPLRTRIVERFLTGTTHEEMGRALRPEDRPARIALPQVTDAFTCRPDCPRCSGDGAVCEDHPDRPFGACRGPGLGCGAAGIPCRPEMRGDPSTWPTPGPSPSTPTP